VSYNTFRIVEICHRHSGLFYWQGRGFQGMAKPKLIVHARRKKFSQVETFVAQSHCSQGSGSQEDLQSKAISLPIVSG
jgi:hypothetical protein